jgi:hypothetical protein
MTHLTLEVIEMKRRALLMVGLLMAGLLVPAGLASLAAAKEETVTLEISGMT